MNLLEKFLRLLIKENYGKHIELETRNETRDFLLVKSPQKEPFAVLPNRCSSQFLNIHRKTPVFKFLLIKKTLQHRCFPVNIAEFLKASFFYKSPLVAASVTIDIQIEINKWKENKLTKITAHCKLTKRLSYCQ